MIIGLLRIQIHIPICESLKEKRSILKKHLNFVRKNFNVGVSEIDDLDLWQLSMIGIVTIGASNDRIDKTLLSIVEYLERRSDIQVSNYKIEYY